MITIEEFLERWDDDTTEMVVYDAESVSSLNISDESKTFLIECGFPDEAAPYLNFESFEDSEILRLSETYGNESEYSKYIYIGTDGDGLPICINEETEEITIIDVFEKQDPVFVNSSVLQMAECLLLYYEFLKKIMEVNGEDAALDYNADEKSLNWIIEMITKTDSNAMDEGSLWRSEIDQFLEENE